MTTVDRTQWMDRAIAAVRSICERQAKLTTDDAWNTGLGDPPESRAMGAVMRHCQRAGWCEATGDYKTSRRPECHGRPVRVWRSLLFGGRAISACLYCGASLEGLRPEAKFCTDIHKAAWHREHRQEAA